MPRDYRLYCEDTVEASGKVEAYIQGMTFEQFSTDTLRIDAVLHNLQIIGEAAKGIPEKVRQHTQK